MTTLISVYTSDGCVGRCDAKCYLAKHPRCRCVCGGANHGVGLNRAIANTTERAEQWLDQYAKAEELDQYTFDVLVKNSSQLALF